MSTVCAGTEINTTKNLITSPHQNVIVPYIRSFPVELKSIFLYIFHRKVGHIIIGQFNFNPHLFVIALTPRHNKIITEIIIFGVVTEMGSLILLSCLLENNKTRM